VPVWEKGRNSKRMKKKMDEREGWRERKQGKERRLEREQDGETFVQSVREKTKDTRTKRSRNTLNTCATRRYDAQK